MKAVASARLLLVAVLTAAWLAAASTAAAGPLEPLPAPTVPYVVHSFGEDPLGEAGPKLAVTSDPFSPDSYYGWYASPVRVALTPDRPATVRYAWDDPSGGWRLYPGPLAVPEGKHVLYAQAGDGVKGPLTAIEVKFDIRSPRLASDRRDAPARVRVNDLIIRPRSGTVSVRATIRPHAGPRVVRIWGPDRYGTSEQIARADFPQGAAVAVVARGDNFPDALAAAPLAGLYDAPIVLTRTAAMPDVTLNALGYLGVRQAIVVGSDRAVSANVVKQLTARGISVERIGGIDRYETAALIARAVVARGGQRGAAFIARGDLYPDSLAVSPFGFRAKRPILLVRPTSLPEVTRSALSDLGVTSAVIAGSDKAVSGAVENAVRAVGVATSRAEGPDRYGTAIAAARYGVANGLGDFRLVGLATGQNFPDALCGGAAVGNLGGVILMTPRDYLADSVAAELRANATKLRDIQVYGSELAVSRAAWDKLLETVR